MQEPLRIAVARRLVVLGALLIAAAPVYSQTPGDAFPARPVHIVTASATVRRLVNTTALLPVDAMAELDLFRGSSVAG